LVVAVMVALLLLLLLLMLLLLQARVVAISTHQVLATTSYVLAVTNSK
jgi:hypothetical protein